MFRIFFGVLIVQLATVALVMLAPDQLEGIAWLRLIIPILVVGLFASFWLSSTLMHKRKDELHQIKSEHAKEKEKIQINAERAKTRLVKKTQQQIAREAKITHTKANFKVGAAFAGAIGAGALMLLTELLTLGMLTISTAGGAMGGYLMRLKKEKSLPKLENKKSTVNMIEDKH